MCVCVCVTLDTDAERQGLPSDIVGIQNPQGVHHPSGWMDGQTND